MNHSILASCILSAGILLAGIGTYAGLHELAGKDRAVTVKGLATREVKADYAVWPIQFTLNGNDLKSLYENEGKWAEEIKKWMMDKGFEANDIRHGKRSIFDNWENYYEHKPEYRYTLTASVVISTKDVDRVVATQDCLDEIMKKGLLVKTNEWELDYQYNGLNELKPEMVEEATKNARVVAQKFAEDADCSLGSIRRASQGQFSIDTDQYQPWMKHVRVVTTVDYYLK